MSGERPLAAASELPFTDDKDLLAGVRACLRIYSKKRVAANLNPIVAVGDGGEQYATIPNHGSV
jgi:hypothetical protein